MLAALAHRADQAQHAPPLTWGSGSYWRRCAGDDARLVTAAPHIHDLVMQLEPDD